VSSAGLIGGGQPIRPGEASLAHRGVLFLDELPELRRSTLEALRQPMESGSVSIARAHGSVELPARFQLAAAMNPCPCGYHGEAARDCTCDPALVKRYRGRISGPLLDRIDLHVPVPREPGASPWSAQPGAGSAALRERVCVARTLQAQRGSLNAQLGTPDLVKFCRPDSAGERLLERAAERLGLSPRAQTRVLRVARTIADLEERARIGADALAEAIGYRWLDREPPRTRGPALG
jgi:magnesium chelatase family protein